MKKVYLLFLFLVSIASIAQNTHTLNNTTTVIAGNLTTPLAGRYNFDLIVPCGYKVKSMTYSMTNKLNSGTTGFFRVGQNEGLFGNTIYSGSMAITGLTAGTHPSFVNADYAVNDDYILTIIREADGVPCTPSSVPVVTTTGQTCINASTTLNIAGSLNNAHHWAIYGGSCGTTLLGISTNSSFTVTASSLQNNYFVRGEGVGITPNSCGQYQLNAAPIDDATFNYSSNEYCEDEPNPTPTRATGSVGQFSSTTGLVINPSTGEINLSASTSGQYTVNYQTTGTCPNSSTRIVVVNKKSYSTDEQIVCDSLLWLNGQVYTDNNSSDQFTLTNAKGCDSVITLNLTVKHSTYFTDNLTVCDSLVWIDGNTYKTDNNTAQHTLTNALGCDSIVSLNLIVNHSSFSVDTQIIEDSYTWMNGITYTKSNDSAQFVLTNSKGCDSIITLNLNIVVYCKSRSTRNRFEWIKAIKLGDNFENISTTDSAGYGNYIVQILVVDPNDSLSVVLTPGYKSRSYDEYWRIWVDMNNDGDFNDVGEKLFEQHGKNIISGKLEIPATIQKGNYRLRISMRWSKYPPSCGSFASGEVEEYSIQVN